MCVLFFVRRTMIFSAAQDAPTCNRRLYIARLQICLSHIRGIRTYAMLCLQRCERRKVGRINENDLADFKASRLKLYLPTSAPVSR